MKDYRLCKHVMLRVDKKKKVALVISGPVYPHFAWSNKLKADTPRIMCSQCRKQIPIRGYVVERDPGSRYVPRKETTNAKPTRKQTSKPDQVSTEGEAWVFRD